MSTKASQITPALDGCFTENLYYERLIRLRAEQPDVFAILSPAEKVTLGYYEAAKHRAEMLSHDKVSEAPREPVTQPTRTANTGEMSAGSRET